jgi:hypothetical protein
MIKLIAIASMVILYGGVATTTTSTTSTTIAATTTTTTEVPETVVTVSESSNIKIVQTTDTIQGACLPSILSLTNKVSSSETEFILTVIASAPLCEPVRATAAVYAMPANGVAWPQTLVEATPFTIFEAGTTVITFYKANACVQFDVITGYAPQTISPLGPWHGPLLFPFDLATAEQYWGCPPEPEPVPVELAPSQSITNLEFTG